MIIEYIGPFGKSGENLNKTRVLYKCDWCGKTQETNIGNLERFKPIHIEYLGHICGNCNQNGMPMAEKDVYLNYPFVDKVLTLGSRGNVFSGSRVLYTCKRCNSVYETEFGVIKGKKRHYCSTCTSYGAPNSVDAIKNKYKFIDSIQTVGIRGGVTGHSKIVCTCSICKTKVVTCFGLIKNKTDYLCRECVKYGAPISASAVYQSYDFIVDIMTHGTRNKNVTDASMVICKCRTCGKNTKTTYGSIKNHKYYYCKSCAPRPYNGFGSSNLHMDIKNTMIRGGILGFVSERWIWQLKFMVDEFHDSGLVIEVFGDYWHCNRELYSAEDIVSFPGNQKKKAKTIWKQDDNRLSGLNKLGYKTFVIWEKSWKESPDRVMSNLLDWYHRNLGE